MAHAPARVVEFWRAVEIFSPQPLPRPDARTRVVDLGQGELMPWESGSRRREEPAPGKVWRHEVFGGVYELARVRDTLVALYDEGEGPGAQRVPVRGQSALFGCTVDSNGMLVPGTAVLSSCAWAIGRAVASRGGLSLDGFDQDVLGYAEALGELAGAGSGARIALRLLAASLRAAAPDAAAETVKAAVAGALIPVAGPVVAVAGATLAGGTVGKVADAMLNGASPRDAAHEGPAKQEPERLDLSPLRAEGLQRFVAQLADRLGVSDALRPRLVRGRSYQVASARAADETERSFLNSFYADDLARVAAALSRRDAGPALAAYLSSRMRIDPARRTDVRAHPADVWRGCLPDRVPPGRWVTNLDRSMALSQQFAVSEIMTSLGDGAGLFAVNGPPGTGKTTMLRDLIAAIVVSRAERLAELRTLAEAFSGSSPYLWQPEKQLHSITPLNPRLTGAEIVVASSNNGAVENVTTEIPGTDGIGAQWLSAAEEVDYFTATARLVHAAGAWGMVAARLGNAANRRAFADSFWWGAPGRQARCMVDLLAGLRARPEDWAAATARFRAAREKVRILAEERAVVALAITTLPILRRDAKGAVEEIATVDDKVRSLQEQRLTPTAALGAAKRRYQKAAGALDRHREARPGLLISLSTLFRAGREWHAEHKALVRRNLCALTDVLKGKGQPPAPALLAAWQTLFLVVPVVSTTFASLPAMFGGPGRESIGWLLVDEAGQAPPQQAGGGDLAGEADGGGG